MAAGGRKIKIRQVLFTRANPVTYEAHWSLWIEDRVGADVQAINGTTTGTFGTAAAWRAMTGLQMEQQVNADVAADARTPDRDNVT